LPLSVFAKRGRLLQRAIMTIAITINIEIVQPNKYCDLDVTECELLALVD
jgi:hypothetical protein